MKVHRRNVLRALAGLPLAATGCRSTARGPAAFPLPFAASEPRTFEAPAKVVLYGDSRGKLPLEFWRESTGLVPELLVGQAVAEKPTLVIHAGDLVETASPASWTAFDAEVAPLRASGIPFFPIAGNHEFFGEASPRFALSRYHARFPALEGRRWYDLQVGPLLFVMVDSNLPELTGLEIATQDAWYLERLDRAESDPSVRWMAVVAHHPPMTNAVMHKPDAFVQSHFAAPSLKRPKVEMFVAGHVHAYERFLVEGRQFVVSGGGGSPRVNLLRAHRWPEAFHGGSERPFHYLRFDVRPDHCNVESVMLDRDTGVWAVGDAFDLA